MKANRVIRAVLLLACGLFYGPMDCGGADAAEKHEVTYAFPDYLKEWKDEKYDLFYGKRPAIYLNGWWKLMKLNRTEKNPADDYGTRNGFFQEHADTRRWDTVFVPWNWCEAKDADQFRGVGWYRRSFTVPEAYKGNRLILKFGQVLSEAGVWINGKPMGKHRMYSYSEWPGNLTYGAFDFDITDQVKFGRENSITVRVYHAPVQAWFAGIIHPVHIEVQPPLYIARIRVTPQWDKKQIEVHCRFDNAGNETDLCLEATLGPWTSYRYKPMDPVPEERRPLGTVSVPQGVTEKTFVVPIAKPAAWTYERPNLYHLVMSSNGQVLGQTRFGFRQISIKVTHFYLNGRKMWVPADELCPPMSARNNIWPFNQDLDKKTGGYGGFYFDYSSVNLTEWLERYKGMNLVLLRAHSDCWTEPMFDRADELGMMVYSELVHIEEGAKRPQDTGGASIFEEYTQNKKLPEGYQDEVRDRLYAHWNHPCVWAFSLGNEYYDNKYTPILCDLFDYVKKEINPPFPVSQSGRYYIYRSDDPFTARPDFYDDHYYWVLQTNWTQIDQFCSNLGTYIHGKLDRPWFNGEGFGIFENWHYERFFNSLKKDLPNINREEYARLFSRTEKDMGSWEWQMISWAGYLPMLYGIRDFLVEYDQGMPRRGEYYKRWAERQRRWKEYATGFATHRINPVRQEYDKALGRIMKRVNSPLYVMSDIYYRHHILAGDEYKTTVYTMNDTLENVPAVRVIIDIVGETAKDKKVFTTAVDYDKILQGEMKPYELAWKVPLDIKTDHYQVNLTLYQGHREVLQNSYRMYILGFDQRKTDFHHTKRVALYVKPSDPLFAGTKYDSRFTRTLFDRLKISYNFIKDFDSLDRYEILVLGTNSFGPQLKAASAAIRQWIEKGGRVLCLEQTDYLGAVPFVREYRIAETEVILADLIVPQHPIFSGLDKGDLDMWDGKDGVITHKYILPVSPSVLAATCSPTQNLSYGMLAAEVRIGKGIVLFSQAQTSLRYGQEAVVTRYLENLFHYVLNTAWNGMGIRDYAIPQITGKQTDFCEIPELDMKQAEFIDLRRVCNRAFADEKGGDGVGGWFDEGASQDMRFLPTGRQTFESVPFDIIDPARNRGKSCIVLNTRGNRWYPKGDRPDEVTIPVGKTLKRMVFLVSSSWLATDTSTAAEIVFHFSGGQCAYETETVPVRANVNIGNWWIGEGLLPEAKVAWSYADPRIGKKVGLYMFEWKNRQPKALIREIVIKTGNTATVPAIVAITGEKE